MLYMTASYSLRPILHFRWWKGSILFVCIGLVCNQAFTYNCTNEWMNWNRQYAKFVISIWLENTIWIFGGMTPEPSKIVKRCRHYMWTRNIKMGISEILSKRTHFSLLIFILRLLPKHIHTFRCFKTWNHGQIQSKGSGWFDIRYISKSRFYVHHKSSVYSKINCSILFSKFLIFFSEYI